MNFNKVSKVILKAVLIITVVAGCVYTGRVEYNDDVISGMNDEKYQYINDRIGGGTRSDVVTEYMCHQEYYDSLTY